LLTNADIAERYGGSVTEERVAEVIARLGEPRPPPPPPDGQPF
jgi:hypothetical protein